EEQYFKNSKVYVAKEFSGNIIGSIRSLKWNYVDILPIQKIFNIDPIIYSNNLLNSEIWHIGRFAIKKEIKDRSLFKRLMVCAIHPICQKKNNIAFAECDSKLLRVLNILGIQTNVVGDSINYLGSETIPIC